MIPYPNIDPEIIRIGPVAVRWYGIMYLLGFASSYFLVKYQIRKKGLQFDKDAVESLYSYLVLGLLIGARLGYAVFYNVSYYAHHPLEIFAVWQGGMSFHGGLIGSVLAGFLFCKKYRLDFRQLADLVIVTAPIGLGFGRIANFINGELYGRVADVPWAMIFPTGGPFPRHPSQLYEFVLEGIVLFAVLWVAKDRVKRTGMLTGLFLLCYGIFRFFIEFFREPDPQLGFVLGAFTMGQILSWLMVFAGVGIIYLRRKK